MAFPNRASQTLYHNLGTDLNNPALPIKPIPLGAKRKNELPSYTDGEEFLQYVVMEREISHRPKPVVKPAKKADDNNPGLKENFVFPVKLKKMCLAEFRNASSQLKARMPELKKRLPLNDNDHFPADGDMLCWCGFCLGVKALVKVEKSSFVKEKKKNSSCESGGFPPFLRLILNLSEQNIEELLFFLSIWLKNLGFTSRQGEWLYALLSVVEKPLSKGLENALHELFVVCADLHKKLKNKNIDAVVSLNAFIYIMKEHFDCKFEQNLEPHDQRFMFVKLVQTDLENESECSELEEEMET